MDTDEELRRRYAAGDVAAMPGLYARYGGLLLSVALKMLHGDRRLAEEAVQVAMVKAWRSASTYDPSRPLAPWLFTIVRRCAIDIGRQEQRHRMRQHDDGRMESPADDRVESAAAVWVVREALGALTAKEHTVIRLAYYEGLTHGEIADRLAIPIGTVKSRWASGMQRLRHELTPTFALAS